MKLEAGQKIWGKEAHRYSKEIEEYTVKSVGRKYFSIVENPHRKFDIETLREVVDFGSPTRVYLSLEEYQDTLEKGNIIEFLERHTKFSHLSLNTLRKLKTLIDEETTPN